MDLFHLKINNINGEKVYTYLATSYQPDIEGEYYYGQLSIAYHKDHCYINVLFKNAESTDDNEWLIKEFILEDREDINLVINSFLVTCKELRIIYPDNLIKHNLN